MLILNGQLLPSELFPNQEQKIDDILSAVQNQNNLLELKYRNDRDLLQLQLVKQRLDEISAPCDLFVWYMPYSRMDRQIPGCLFTLKYVCQLIAQLCFDQITVVEPHSPATLQLLQDGGQTARAVYPTMDWLPRIMRQVGFKPTKDVLVLPDKGARGRYQNLERFRLCTLAKQRDPQTGKILNMQLEQGEITPGCKCIILDDLCAKGGTFAWGGQILKSLGASQIYLVVTHCEKAVFDGQLLADGSPIEQIFASRSLMDEEHPKIAYQEMEVSHYVQKSNQ